MQQAINLIKGDKHGDNVDYRDYLPVNCSPVLRDMLGSQGYMLQQPGLTEWTNAVGIDRGGIWNERQSKHFRISGKSLVSIDRGGNVTTIGTISGTGTASLPYSFNTQAIITEGRMWLYDATNGLVEVTDSDLGTPKDGVWVDGYYFLTDGEFIYHTDLADESSIDPLKYATSEFSPDPTVGVGLTSDNKVIAFNRYTTEYFSNQANENFAFTRIPARAVKYGLVGTHAKCEIGGQYFFLGGAKEESVSVYALGVGTASVIASREVSKLIQQYNEDELSAAVMESRTIDDYPYLILHLPNETLLCSIKVGAKIGPEYAWSILKSDVAGDDPWRGIHGVMDPRLGKWVYGDKLGAKVGILDESVGTHYGELAECIIYTPFTYLEEMSIDELEIFTIPGFNVTDDAQVMFSATQDGVTHSMEQSLAYGAPGAYGARFIARRIGYVDDWFAFKLRWASTSRMCFSTARIKYA